MKAFLTIVLGSAVIFFCSWFSVSSLKINSLDIQSEDTLPAMFLPYSIVQNGNIYLDRFYDQLVKKYPQPDDKDYKKGNVPFYLIKVENHYLSAFTIIAPLLALPVYFFPVIFGVLPTWQNLIILSHMAEALLMGLSGWLLYLIATKRLNLETKLARTVTVIYLFATINYGLVSQALWQHGSVQLLLLTGLYFYLSESYYINYLLSGIFWGFAFLARPTALLPIALFFGTTLLSFRPVKEKLSKLVVLAFGALPAVTFFLWYNSTFYRSFTNQGYSSQLFTSWLGDFPVSFFGVWLSPSKGILIYSPILIFSLIGFVLALKNKNKKVTDLYIISGFVVFIHTLVISFWKHWYGGWSFGYRMSSDVIPFMVLMIVPFLQSAYYQKYKKLFICLLTLSIIIQILSFIFYDGIWHAAYDKGFHDTSWLWSVKDSEFVFNIRRVLVKLNLLSQACPKCLPQ
ncbi:hypothetical protein GYA27_00400 [candidate division WWE3 bacterium]|uniref:Glycosyltransferase RgtA/B/C/D-like domain-containing protein n=1 Tax=candidate division WWE3 bacterium TaxID=2053526 RepID=A0A7X9DJJ4_UNCKA|nr:hypothetical protein [candidate division WWE3 bacterium]